MTHPDPMRLARCLQLRDLIAIIFKDPTPWGQSLPVQVLADHLEAAGHQEAADAVRGRIVDWAENSEWQMTGFDARRDGPGAPVEYEVRFLMCRPHENPIRKQK